IIWTILIIAITMITLILTFYPPWVLVIVRRVWAPFILFIVGIDLKVKGLENIDPQKNYIIMSNHTSYLDVPILLAAYPKNIYFVAKKELLRIPFFGWMMWLLGMIFIDRSNPRKSIKSMKIAALKLKKGKNVLVFPEGTFDDNGVLLPFKKGTFHIAVKAKMSILPVAIIGGHKIWPGGNLFNINRGKVTVKIGTAFKQEEVDDIKAIDALKNKAENTIRSMIAKEKK
ncbi:MAG: lysophospholipid acyltransferase family protein, partial [Putridiphycobacter sp.]|nr:lysophospholipid acyltransferase family protein [Putridiphycobacter sp.]